MCHNKYRTLQNLFLSLVIVAFLEQKTSTTEIANQAE